VTRKGGERGISAKTVIRLETQGKLSYRTARTEVQEGVTLGARGTGERGGTFTFPVD